MNSVLLFSGGLDSTVLLYDLLRQGDKPHCLLVYYGQRHLRESDCARATCNRMGVQWVP